MILIVENSVPSCKKDRSSTSYFTSFEVIKSPLSSVNSGLFRCKDSIFMMVGIVVAALFYVICFSLLWPNDISKKDGCKINDIDIVKLSYFI